MNMPIAIRRYVTALIEAATEKSILDKIYKDAQAYIQLIDSSKELQYLIANLVIQNDKKLVVLEEIYPKLNDLTLNALKLLSKNNRLLFAKDFFKCFIDTVDAQKGIVKGTLTTPIPVNNQTSEYIISELFPDSNKKIYLENIVDTSLLGGFVVRVEDMQYDTSISSKLRTLQTKFLNP